MAARQHHLNEQEMGNEQEIPFFSLFGRNEGLCGRGAVRRVETKEQGVRREVGQEVGRRAQRRLCVVSV